jgi:hypothetical protein
MGCWDNGQDWPYRESNSTGSCNKSCNILTFPQISTIVDNQALEPIHGRLWTTLNTLGRSTGSSPVRAASSLTCLRNGALLLAKQLLERVGEWSKRRETRALGFQSWACRTRSHGSAKTARCLGSQQRGVERRSVRTFFASYARSGSPEGRCRVKRQTTGITTAVVMVVVTISPQEAWKQPLLRLLDTIVGIAIGIGLRKA